MDRYSIGLAIAGAGIVVATAYSSSADRTQEQIEVAQARAERTRELVALERVHDPERALVVAATILDAQTRSESDDRDEFAKAMVETYVRVRSGDERFYATRENFVRWGLELGLNRAFLSHAQADEILAPRGIHLPRFAGTLGEWSDVGRDELLALWEQPGVPAMFAAALIASERCTRAAWMPIHPTLAERRDDDLLDAVIESARLRYEREAFALFMEIAALDPRPGPRMAAAFAVGMSPGQHH